MIIRQPRCLNCTSPAAFNCFDVLLCAEHFVSIFASRSVASSPELSAPAAVNSPAAAGAVPFNCNSKTMLRVAASSATQEPSHV